MPKIEMPKVFFAVPDNYFKMNAAPNDPADSTPFGSESGGCTIKRPICNKR